ncbi:glycoside hydrolase family 16 protein [Amniculicola lignicola CBS 123094]|uniref:Glycoside hydrolase family 16 protein n=1 Tax=Amniculicola lignicola CBS 123094 TaxID=1392246 RepID=A0A6A5X515_9PLEO|nr:glycoside hydrolase family 16 protein [Amniculicola lignicola CBS 123094]
MNSKPTSPQPQGQPPPLPINRPQSFSNATSAPAPPHNDNLKVYWKPSLDQATPVSTSFNHELGAHGWGNNESQNYVASPQNSFHTPANQLVVRAIAQNGSYTSARLTSHQKLSRPKGYLEAKILAPCAEGVWPAFWMLPADPFKWPTDGEIDIMETWNNELKNHSCLHWGNFDGPDHDKHRVMETSIPDMAYKDHVYGFSWIEEEGIPDFRGRLIWYIDGRPIMRGYIPLGTRRMEDFRLLINVAMGGNVCQGRLPREGMYDLVVSDLKFCEEPVGGWSSFESSWNSAPEGKTM